ncbi:uncharacterized protein [Littorina saxatilis]|uniref:uncharacterized protein n=1 Tax=Littorina saxatilis TaxID=31220 RepID=UPI0038B69DE4
MADVILTIPSKCYVNLNCIAKATSTLAVSEYYHTISDSDRKVRYVITASPTWTIFEFAVGQTFSSFGYAYTGVGTYNTGLSLRGQGFVPTLSLIQVVGELETLILPASVTIYRTKTNIINIGKPNEGTVDTVGKASGTLDGTLSFGPFSGNTMQISILPSNAVGTATLSLSVTSTCDCGYVCSCYVATQNMPTITVKDPVQSGATVSTNLLLPGDSLTMTINIPEAVQADTVISFASVCSLTFSTSSVSWNAGSGAEQRFVTITAPGTITAVQSCPITFTVNDLAPQFIPPSDIGLTIGPKTTVAYTALQTSMTQSVAYSFSIALSRVYAGRPVTIAPQCSSATFSPASFTFAPAAALTKEFTITGTGSGCSVVLDITNTGSSDVILPADRPVTFTNSKTVAVSAPPLLYVNQIGGSDIVLSSTFTGAQYIDIVIFWSGPAGVVAFSNSSIRLDIATPAATVTITALSNGTGTINFTATTTFTTNFDTGIAPLGLTVRNPVVPTSVPAIVPANMSTDPYYSITLTIDITGLPSDGADVVTVVLDYQLQASL